MDDYMQPFIPKWLKLNLEDLQIPKMLFFGQKWHFSPIFFYFLPKNIFNDFLKFKFKNKT